MPREGEPVQPSMADALAAIQTQGQALEALVGQAVDTGITGMAETTTAARKLATAGKSAVTRRMNGGRKTLDQVGGPGAALAGQQLATQAEMLGLIPGAVPTVPPGGAGPVQGPQGHGLGAGGYIPGSAAEAQYIADNAGKPGFIPAGSLQQPDPKYTPGLTGPTIGQGPINPDGGPTIGQGPLTPEGSLGQADLPPGTVTGPSWADPSWPYFYVPSGADVAQLDGSHLFTHYVQWPCDPVLWMHAHPVYLQAYAQSPYPDAQIWIPATMPAVLASYPYGCPDLQGPGSMYQNGQAPHGQPGGEYVPPLQTGPTITQGPIGTGPTITQGPLPPINTISQIGCPPPVINLTCPACGNNYPPPPLPPPTPPPEPPPKKVPPTGWEDYLEIRSDGSYSVYVSLNSHSEFSNLVEMLLHQTVINETEAEPKAASADPEYSKDTELIFDTWG